MKTKRYSIYKSLVLQDERSSKLDFNVDGRVYYVYRVTQIDTNEHYYGARTRTKRDIIEDFWEYCTSSKRKEIIKSNRENYKVKILKIFDNSNDMYIYESFLHQYFNVRNHSKFWNRANQTPWGFIQSKESVDKCKATKSSKEWKETVGKEATRKMIENVDWSEISRKASLRYKDIEWCLTKGKERNESQSITKQSKEWKETVGKEVTRKHKETLLNGRAKEIGIAGSITKQSKEWKETIGKEANRKLKETLSGIDCSARSVKSAETCKLVILDNGLSILQQKIINKSNTQRLKRNYSIYNHKGEILYDNLLQCEVLQLNHGLLKTSKDRRLGNNYQGKRALNENNKLHMKGWYCEENKNNTDIK